MLKDQDIICISTIDWDFIWQGHQEIMSTFAKNGNRVLFIENTGVRAPNFRDIGRLKKRVSNYRHSTKGIRKERDNLYIYSPVVLPFPYSRIARWVNKRLIGAALDRWMKSVGFTRPIVWTFLPTGIALDIIDFLNPKLVIYYCIDNFSASSPFARKIKPFEDKLIGRADLIFVTAKKLQDRCAPFNNDIHTFPFGVAMDIYEKAMKEHPKMPVDMASIKQPIVGYVGGVHKWVNLELVRRLASEHKDKSFVFVGPLQTDVAMLKELKNVHFLGQKKYEELPGYVANFDVCLIPYLRAEYTDNVYPTKLNEYLALGKPVVSTDIPEVVAYNQRNGGIVAIASTEEEFSRLVGAGSAEKTDEAVRRKRVDAAIFESTWKVKIEKMSELIEAAIVEKEKSRSKKWKDSMLKLYKRSTRKIMPALAVFLAAYLIIFHTQFLWSVAKPLKVSSPLKKAGAIVVLAGGVGESGQAGQGYEERVKYAVELYGKGYAPFIIFSSGYSYAFKETDVMKALAVSLGVPAGAIILEDKAGNTYENIKYSGEILSGKGVKSAIVVSSPYNMLRVSLSAKKAAPMVEFIWAPVPKSLFYGDDNKVELKHVVAIIHEYIGIAYYWLKGDI